ncbi:unnamed protein product [Fusarium equiseti]|uniref:HNH nuclease domain-containing protein n=1 Tax=Fusarium equiseti TaxID=61235 RepID=A0A8J2NE26_FUSEQ|nr:unnamed protein product [Fusarium equiseti]
MASLSQSGIPHPLPGLNDLGTCISYGERLKEEIQFLWPNFTLRMEQHALLMVADRKHFGNSGALSTSRIPSSLKRQLEEASPFCKHYWMHHLLPHQPDDVWKHALRRPPIYRPNLTLEDYQEADWETISQKIYYDQHFRTNPELKTLSLGQGEVRKCMERDQFSCVVTHTKSDRLFPFIPIGWNNSVDNNNATGNLEEVCLAMADVNLMKHILSVFELGRSHKAWNLICVNPDLYTCLISGFCGFKYHETIPIEGEGGQTDGKVQVVLVFYWMPQGIKARFNEEADAVDLEDIARAFNNFTQPPLSYPKQGPVPRSGDKVHLPMTREDAEKLMSAVKVHWACVLYLVLCGGTGQPQYLTGMDQSDGSLQPRDEEFARQKAGGAMLGQPMVQRSISSAGPSSSKAPEDRSSDQSSGAPSVFSSTGRRTDTDHSSAGGSSLGERSSK